jgi:DNA-binding NarL/FixJ family response regulator
MMQAMTESSPTVETPANRHLVFLVDDHPLVREGLQKLIEYEGDMTVCGEAEDAVRAYERIEQAKPDVVIVDLSLRGDSGLDLIKRLPQLERPPRALVLSMHDESHYAERALRAGAAGYVMKRETSSNIITAIRHVLAGGIFVSEAISAQMAARSAEKGSNTANPPVERLSDRELEVFLRIGQGQETRRIADELHLSLKTIQTHCAHIKEKLGLENATELMLVAVRWVEAGRPS